MAGRPANHPALSGGGCSIRGMARQDELDYVRVQRARAAVVEAQGRHDDAALYREDADLTERLANTTPGTPEHDAASEAIRAFRARWRSIRDAFGTHRMHGKIEGISTVDDIPAGLGED